MDGACLGVTGVEVRVQVGMLSVGTATTCVQLCTSVSYTVVMYQTMVSLCSQ